ncbi:MAG: hypothetical protein ACLVHE_03250 [Dialister invisus]
MHLCRIEKSLVLIYNVTLHFILYLMTGGALLHALRPRWRYRRKMPDIDNAARGKVVIAAEN